jgi:hypothetical protein
MFVHFSITNEAALLLFISFLSSPGIIIRIQKLRKRQSKQDDAESQQHRHPNIDPHH